MSFQTSSFTGFLSFFFTILKSTKFMTADMVRPIPSSFNPVFRSRTQVFNIAVEPNSLHTFIGFMLFVILGFLQLRYQGNPTPFELHTKIIWISIASFLVYCLVFLSKLIFGLQIQHCDALMKVFSSLSMISLTLLLLPESWESLSLAILVVHHPCVHHLQKKSQKNMGASLM